MPNERKKKRKTPTKWAGPLNVLPKQCVWCSKNGHQMGAIKPFSAKKRKRKKKGGSKINHRFLTPFLRLISLRRKKPGETS